MQSSISHWLDLLENEPETRAGLLVASLALRLDDEVAGEALRLIVPSADPPSILRTVKDLPCVRADWDGTWRVAEDSRPALAQAFEVEFGDANAHRVRQLLATRASERAASYSPDGEITALARRTANFEVGFQRSLLPESRQEGAAAWIDIWREGSNTAKTATCRAVDYLSQEISQPGHEILPEVRFLVGMNAYKAGDSATAHREFRSVWEHGRPGDVFAIAAHLFGLLEQDREIAESAFRSSLEWHEDRHHQGQVWHSLGNLLSRQSGRWEEAEDAFRHSLELDLDRHGQAQVWHSLGNLLSRQSGRWEEAEDAFRHSLELDQDRHGQAQVLVSLAHAQIKWGEPAEAAKCAQAAIELNPDDLRHQGMAHVALGLAYERIGMIREAIEAYETVVRVNQQIRDRRAVNQALERIAKLERMAAPRDQSEDFERSQ